MDVLSTVVRAQNMAQKITCIITPLPSSSSPAPAPPSLLTITRHHHHYFHHHHHPHHHYHHHQKDGNQKSLLAPVCTPSHCRSLLHPHRAQCFRTEDENQIPNVPKLHIAQPHTCELEQEATGHFTPEAEADAAETSDAEHRLLETPGFHQATSHIDQISGSSAWPRSCAFLKLNICSMVSLRYPGVFRKWRGNCGEKLLMKGRRAGPLPGPQAPGIPGRDWQTEQALPV